MSFPAKNKDEFIHNFFENAQPLEQYDGAGVVVRTEKTICKWFGDDGVDGFVQEARQRGWKLIKVNNQILGYHPEKNPSFKIEPLC